MTRGSIVLAKGDHFGTLYKLNVEPICCNMASKKLVKTTVMMHNANSLEDKLPAEKIML